MVSAYFIASSPAGFTMINFDALGQFVFRMFCPRFFGSWFCSSLVGAANKQSSFATIPRVAKQGFVVSAEFCFSRAHLGASPR